MTTPSAGADALGGYFELDPGPPRGHLLPDALAVQSARAALQVLLAGVSPARLWMPWYLCETMFDAPRRLGIPVVRFGLEEDFSVGAGVELAPGDVLLVVNYFGLCDRQVDAAIGRFGPQRVVVDNSHALFAVPRPCLGTLYSPRKFVGVPDGGYLSTGVSVQAPEAEDTGSAQRCLPLLVRLAEGAERGYAAYLEQEDRLSAELPMRMSRLTARLLEAVDFAAVAARRKENFDRLDAAVGAGNRIALRRDAAAVPLSYPYLGGGDGLRAALHAHRIYVPRYWPHLRDETNAVPAFERHLAQHCLPIPCDQRNDASRMDYAADVVAAHAAP